jgi:hypothetical protein
MVGVWDPTGARVDTDKGSIVSGGVISLDVSRFQGTVARSERQCYLFRTSTKRFHKVEERMHKMRGVNNPGLETKLRLRSQCYGITL